ncbi:MAG TPA: hypothetical protein VD902_15980, partial [Symbiobacteriaceae bacterium]|nr:hypothetical protein [Symbiobacteriaceae bacterium]
RLPWRRHPTPVVEMEGLQLTQIRTLTTEYPDYNAVRLVDGQLWWYTRAPGDWLSHQLPLEELPGEPADLSHVRHAAVGR